MNILITGTSTGFGKLMVDTLAQAGHNVVATMRGVNGRNAEAAAELSAKENVSVEEVDVTDQASIDRAVDATLQRHGRVDVLVNNAGVFGNGLLEAYSVDRVQQLFDINVYGPLRMNKAVLPSMRANGDGLIINISSTLGVFTIPLAVPYCASKHALEGFVRGSYPELIQVGVENILLEPGAFPTELSQKAGINADQQEVIDSYNGLQDQMNAFADEVMTRTITTHMPNPQDVADRTLELIQMEKGTRPQRNFVDPIGQPELLTRVENEFGSLENEWKANYGFG